MSIEVQCPHCRRPTEFSPTNRWRPFCSERCRNLDLGAWASESYRVPARPDPDDEAGASEAPDGAHH